MNLALWIVQGLVAAVMLGAGMFKSLLLGLKLVEKFKWAATWSDANVKLLGLAEVLGAVGLVAPIALGILPILTPVAALCLAVLMVGAVKTHLDSKEPWAPAGVPLILCLVIAGGRFFG